MVRQFRTAETNQTRAYEHDKELLRRLSARLKQMEQTMSDHGIAVPKPTAETHIPMVDEFEYETVDATSTNSGRGPNPLLDSERVAAGSGMSGRAAAEEDRYIYDKDKDNVKKYGK